MKITVEVDQSKWYNAIQEKPFPIGHIHIPVADVYDHPEYIYRIIYDWGTGIYTIMRPCGAVVCCVQDLMIAQTIVQLIATNKP